MPASPSFPSDTRNKWKKRKRSTQDDDDDDDDDPVAEEGHQDRVDGSEDRLRLQSGRVGVDLRHSHENEVLVGSGVRVWQFPLVIKHAVNRPHSSVIAVAGLERANFLGESRSQLLNPLFLENVSYGQLQALSSVPADSPVFEQERNEGGSSAYVATPPPILEGSGVVKRFGSRTHVVPMHSDWFSPTTVHRLERQVVPHFFSGKSPDHTPEKYMEIRNYIVSKYMEDPEKNLTVSSCQGLVAGVDTEDLTRIVRFLNHWGIINYCSAAPSCETLNGESSLTEDSNGELQVPSDALKSIDSLIKFERPKCKLKVADVYPSFSSHNDDVPDLDSKIRERLSENHCSYCSQPIPIVYYQSQREVDVLLCSGCFHEGRFVIGHSSIDFVKMDSTKDYGELDGETWTDQETLLLLEAMEIYNDNWNEIAEHVGTKTKSQCILHFLRLPIEDGIMENIEVPSKPMLSNSSNKTARGRLHLSSNGDLEGSCIRDPNSEGRVPFANSGNPVMALVAFLASAVGPRVAAACAHASLAALSEENGLAAAGSNAQMEGSGQGHRMNADSSYGETSHSSQQKEEKLWGQNEAANAPLSAEKVKAAAKAGLAAAAMKAKLFADHEEREIQRFSANIINHQLKRLELKLKQFAEVETLLMKECEQVERARQRFAAERARIISARFGTAGVTSSMSLPGAAPVMVNNNAGNNMPLLSATRSQPSISGYGNNEPVNPNMPFMQPRQSMFGLGPRLPLSAIQSTSSAAPNVMFNSPGNAQPASNHPMLRSVSGTSSGLG